MRGAWACARRTHNFRMSARRRRRRHARAHQLLDVQELVHAARGEGDETLFDVVPSAQRRAGLPSPAAARAAGRTRAARRRAARVCSSRWRGPGSTRPSALSTSGCSRGRRRRRFGTRPRLCECVVCGRGRVPETRVQRARRRITASHVQAHTRPVSSSRCTLNSHAPTWRDAFTRLSRAYSTAATHRSRSPRCARGGARKSSSASQGAPSGRSGTRRPSSLRWALGRSSPLT